MIDLKCTLEVFLDNETVTKSYNRRFNSEQITREDLDKYFADVTEQFVGQDIDNNDE